MTKNQSELSDGKLPDLSPAFTNKFIVQLVLCVWVLVAARHHQCQACVASCIYIILVRCTKRRINTLQADQVI